MTGHLRIYKTMLYHNRRKLLRTCTVYGRCVEKCIHLGLAMHGALLRQCTVQQKDLLTIRLTKEFN